jgi:DNA-binding transcriptional LysR family regulator
MFETELLRSFRAVAEAGGFTRAAEILHSTQSTVSAQIRRLELQAGRPLFTRSTRNVALTPAGETLLGYARTILQLNDDARAQLSGPGYSGKLRVGVSEDLAQTWLPGILQRYARHHPALHLALEIGIGTRLFRMLDDRKLDLVVAGRCHRENTGWRLWQEPLVWAFAEQEELPEPLPLAFFPEPCPYREAAVAALPALRRTWRIACTSPSMAGVKAIALAGLAATPIPQSALCPGLRILDQTDGLPALPNVEYLVRVAANDRRKPVLTLAELIRSWTGRRGAQDFPEPDRTESGLAASTLAESDIAVPGAAKAGASAATPRGQSFPAPTSSSASAMRVRRRSRQRGGRTQA